MIYVLIAILLAVAILVVWLASIDGSYYVTRSIKLDVSRENAFALILDFNTWTKWSPWLCMEPDADIKISSDGKSVGAVYWWAGQLVGSGEIEHKNIVDHSSLDQEIRFLKPFKSKSDVFWHFEGKGETCELTWGMKGKMPFFFKFMAKRMEPWIGMDYERGLKMIKDLLEKGSVASQIEINGVDHIPATSYIGIKNSCLMKDIESSMQETFGRLKDYISENNIENHLALTVYHNFDFNNPNCEYSSGIVTTERLKNPTDGIFEADLPSQKAVKVTFTGDYKHLGNAWSAAYSYARNKRLKINKAMDPVEFYLNDPSEENDSSKWKTEIYLPIK